MLSDYTIIAISFFWVRLFVDFKLLPSYIDYKKKYVFGGAHQVAISREN